MFTVEKPAVREVTDEKRLLKKESANDISLNIKSFSNRYITKVPEISKTRDDINISLDDTEKKPVFSSLSSNKSVIDVFESIRK